MKKTLTAVSVFLLSIRVLTNLFLSFCAKVLEKGKTSFKKFSPQNLLLNNPTADDSVTVIKDERLS